MKTLRNTYHIYYADKVRVLLYVCTFLILTTYLSQTDPTDNCFEVLQQHFNFYGSLSDSSGDFRTNSLPLFRNKRRKNCGRGIKLQLILLPSLPAKLVF